MAWKQISRSDITPGGIYIIVTSLGQIIKARIINNEYKHKKEVKQLNPEDKLYLIQ